MVHNPLFEVTPGHLGAARTTKVKELSTGREMNFMGALPIGHAIKQFERQIDDYTKRRER
jgi:hypothetical protein